jgi:hypothetical protein
MTPFSKDGLLLEEHREEIASKDNFRIFNFRDTLFFIHQSTIIDIQFAGFEEEDSHDS